MTDALVDRIGGLGRRALIVGAAAVVLSLVGAFFQPTQFFRSYLLAFLFWGGIGVGCLSLLCVQHLTGGNWGYVIRRLLEAGTRTLPLVGLAVVPVLLGLSRIYIWAAPEAVHDPILRHKSVYLNPGFFMARTLFYFAVWSVMALFLSRWSLRLDAGPDRRLERRLRGLSGGGLLLLGLTITFSSIDWAMSLEPHWFSTIFGILFMIGQVLQALTLAILVVASLRDDGPWRRVADSDAAHDLGKLLFAFIMVWAYIHLSQFLIVWSANLPEEIPWYLRRMRGGWNVLGAVVIATHFVLPFLALLSRPRKRNIAALARIAGLVFAARWLELIWVVAPSMDRPTFMIHWLDLLLTIGLGGLWLGLFARELTGRPMLARAETDLAGAA